MGMLAARIRKQDQVNGDTVLVQPNEKGGAVRTAAIGNNIDMLTSFQSLFISVFRFIWRPWWCSARDCSKTLEKSGENS